MAPGAAFGGAGSARYRNLGLARIAISPVWIPDSKLPLDRPSLKKASGAARSRSVTGRRKASRAMLDRILVAHGNSSASLAGLQMKIRWRFAVSFNDVAGVYGPTT